MDQLTFSYRLDRRSKTLYYLRIFFNLWDMALVNAYIVYGKLTEKKLSHLDFHIIVKESLTGNYNNQRRNPEPFDYDMVLQPPPINQSHKCHTQKNPRDPLGSNF